MRNGDVLTDPAHGDSHEDLIRDHGLRDSGLLGAGGRDWVRIEYCEDAGVRSLRLDEWATPEWWAGAREGVEERLAGIVERMSVRGEVERIDSGCWILEEGALVGEICGNARVVWIRGDAKVGSVSGNATVGNVYGSARVGDVSGSARVGNVYGSARVGDVSGSARVGYVYGGATIGSILGSAMVESVYGSAKILRDLR
jgi:hypothetical protein